MIAACFALVAFAAAVVVGLAAGNPAGTILWRALVAMLVCWVAGALVGYLAQRAVQVQVESYKTRNPIPPDEGEEVIESLDPANPSDTEASVSSPKKNEPSQTRAA